MPLNKETKPKPLCTLVHKHEILSRKIIDSSLSFLSFFFFFFFFLTKLIYVDIYIERQI